MAVVIKNIQVTDIK